MYEQPITPCLICNEPTTMLGTKLCDRCWELDSRIRYDLDIALKIVDTVIHENEEILGELE